MSSILAYDIKSERYFRTSYNELRMVEIALRYMLDIHRKVTLNDVYRLLKLDDIPDGNNFGWILSDDQNDDCAYLYNFFEIFTGINKYNNEPILQIYLTCELMSSKL